MQAGDVLGEPRHGLPRPGRLADIGGDIERDFAELAFLEQDARRVARSEADVLGFGVREADDLVAPLRLTTTPVGGVDLAFVTPDADQLFGRSAQDVAIDIALPVAGMADEHEARGLEQVVMPLPVAAERAGERHIASQFGVHQCFDHVVIRLGDGPRQFARAQSGQEQRAADGRAALGVILQRLFHARRVFPAEADDRELVRQA